ncbi:MAG: glycoside hydrolase family 20 protein [Phocaeicola sp.]|uniref:glycoside hydrolase family 20 protein n=1 Tax=Phocaeicola sp. TaxID=2773926 RepID=UPI003F9F014A
MNKLFLLIITLFLLPLGGWTQTISHIIPQPVIIIPGDGFFVFSDKTDFAVENERQEQIAETFTNLFTQAVGFTPKIKVGTQKGDVVFKKDVSLAEEAYNLEITKKKITITASSDKGYFYGLQTIRQLLTPGIESPRKVEAGLSVPAMIINDNPRFKYRGLMIDVARYFLPKEKLLRIIDVMGSLKLNALHLHLTDGNGWRLEIKKYPLLTQIGSRRVERKEIPFPDRRNARQGESTKEIGFYSQSDIKEIVNYAGQRQITVIPEIDMPAHSNAALAAYPMLACPVVDKYIGVLPGLGGDQTSIIFCAGNDSVFSFINDILDEVIDLFPSHYIHIGGDEVNTTYWQKCPLCQDRMQKEHIHDVSGLQTYFMRRVNEYLRSKGREMMGWDELTRNTLPEGAVIFGWRELGKAGEQAGGQGHKFIMTPEEALCLNRYQGPQWFEPITYFANNNTLKDVYDYEPVERSWSMSVRKNLLGIQGSLWTEFCNKPEDVEYLLFPRLEALAESAWTAPELKNWKSFLTNVDVFNTRLKVKGVYFAKSMFNIDHDVLPRNGQLQVKLSCIRPDVEIHYTMDGKEPTAHSDLYNRPIMVKANTTVKAATFMNDKRMGELLTIPIIYNKATATRLLRSNVLEQHVLNGVRGSIKYTDGEWAGWTQNDSVCLTIDLLKRQSLSKVTIGMMNNHGMAVHKAKTIKILLSDNDIQYWKVGEQRYITADIFKESTEVEDLPILINGTARYIRIILKGPGKCPELHARMGKEAHMYVDEIMVE